MKILIDPCYVNTYPYYLLPKIFQIPIDRYSRTFSGKRNGWIGPFPWWAFGPQGFDGMDLGFSYTYLLRSDLSLREDVLEQYRRAHWPIHAFHATFDGGYRIFN